jgi:hypothetical protein
MGAYLNVFLTPALDLEERSALGTCWFMPEEIPPVPVAYEPDRMHSQPEGGGERRNF